MMVAAGIGEDMCENLSWNPVLNFVIEVKHKYVEKYSCVEYKTYGNDTCLEFWIKTIGNPEWIDKIKFLEINQMNEFILIRYAKYSDTLSEDIEITLNEIWDLYDGFYMECRSITIDLKNECIVLSPFRKFHNINERPETQMDLISDKIRNSDSVEISNKLDGSMQCARWYNGKLFMSGSQATNPERSWRLEDGINRISAQNNYLLMLKENPDYTFIFEYITLEDAHIVKYRKDQEGLYLIGIRDIKTGRQFSYKDVLDIANQYHVLSTQVFNKTFEEALHDVKTIKSDQQEGFVINIDGFLVKLKMDDYVHIHGILSRISSINLVIKNMADDTIDDLLSKIPDAYRNRVFSVMRVVNRYVEQTNLLVNSYYMIAPKQDKKEFMIWVDENVPKKFRSYVRNMYLGISNNFLKGSGKNPHYKTLKEMGVTDYHKIFEEDV